MLLTPRAPACDFSNPPQKIVIPAHLDADMR